MRPFGDLSFFYVIASLKYAFSCIDTGKRIFFTYKSSAQEFDADPDQQIGCAPADA